MDAILSVQYLVDNAGSWHEQLLTLTKYANERYEEYMEEYKRVLTHARAKKAKSPSISSIHSDKEEVDLLGVPPRISTPQLSELIEYNPLEAGNRFIYAQAHRKRKPGTSIRSNVSGPRVVRGKKLVIIYYDGHIQSELDKLVRAYGAARNNLRKGRLTYTASKGLFLPSTTRRQDNHLGSSKVPLLVKQTSETSLISTTSPPTGEAAFGQIDKELEQVQSLCENAAHQAIRDGDISRELTDAASKIQVVLATAQSALDMFKADKARSEEEVQNMENRSVSDSTSIQSTLCEKSSLEALNIFHKTLPPVVETLETMKRPVLAAAVSAPSAPLITDSIEVDDGDEDDESFEMDIDISNYRVGARR